MRHLRACSILSAGIILVAAAWPGVACGQKEQDPADRGPQRLAEVPLENAYRLSPRIFSGGEPRTDNDFAALARLGVSTVISVDGQVPSLEVARRHGLAYVHLPMGYDGVPREQQLKIVRALSSAKGPVYFHCHHGRHRGPAAAAVGCLATEGWTKDDAASWLKQAGTSADYKQLFLDVEAFRPPSAGEMATVSATLPEKVEPPPLVEAMLQIDALHDELLAWEKAGFAAVQKDSRQPAQSAVLLDEQYRELARSDAARFGNEAFRELLKRAGDASAALSQQCKSHPATEDRPLSADEKQQLAAGVHAVSQSCKQCHARFRDRPGQ